MMFENDPTVGSEPGRDPALHNELAPDPTLRSQVVAHLPIAVLVLGVLAAMVSLHVAATGVLVLAIAHVAVGVILFAIRQHRATPAEAGQQ